MEFVHYEITYESDMESYGVSDYWQTAEWTRIRKKGDCEDSCILFMKICYDNLEYNSQLVAVREKNRKNAPYHAIVKLDNKYWDVTANCSYEKKEIKSMYNILITYSYDRTMYYALQGFMIY